jgi:hypothetical protein
MEENLISSPHNEPSAVRFWKLPPGCGQVASVGWASAGTAQDLHAACTCVLTHVCMCVYSCERVYPVRELRMFVYVYTYVCSVAAVCLYCTQEPVQGRPVRFHCLEPCAGTFAPSWPWCFPAGLSRVSPNCVLVALGR